MTPLAAALPQNVQALDRIGLRSSDYLHQSSHRRPSYPKPLCHLPRGTVSTFRLLPVGHLCNVSPLAAE